MVKSPDVKIRIISPEIINEININNPDYLYYAFDVKNYIKFSIWLNDVLRHIRQQKYVIESYEKDAENYNAYFK